MGLHTSEVALNEEVGAFREAVVLSHMRWLHNELGELDSLIGGLYELCHADVPPPPHRRKLYDGLIARYEADRAHVADRYSELEIVRAMELDDLEQSLIVIGPAPAETFDTRMDLFLL